MARNKETLVKDIMKLSSEISTYNNQIRRELRKLDPEFINADLIRDIEKRLESCKETSFNLLSLLKAF